MPDKSKTITYSKFVITAVLRNNQQLNDIKTGVESCVSKQFNTDISNVDVLGLTWNANNVPSTIDVIIQDISVGFDNTPTDVEKSIYVSLEDNWNGVVEMQDVKTLDYTVGI